MNAGQVGATTHPLLALGMIPERTDHLPAVAMIDRAKQAAWQRAAPDDARFVGTAGLQRPDARRAPRERSAPHVIFFEALWLWRVGGGRNLFPIRRRRAMQFDAEVTMIERHKVAAATLIRQRKTDIVAQEVHLRDVPVSVLACDLEQPLASRDEDGVIHGQPPDKAWNT